MKGSMQAAAAIGIGYVLGRNRRFRAAAMMAAGMSLGGTAVGGVILKRGMKMLGSTEAIQKVAPQVGDLVDVVRGDLVSAGKAAATSAVSNRVDKLTDSIHDRAERVRNPGAAAAEGADKAARTGKRAASTAGSAAGGTARRLTGRRRVEAEEPEADEYEAEEYEDRDEYEGDEEDRDEEDRDEEDRGEVEREDYDDRDERRDDSEDYERDDQGDEEEEEAPAPRRAAPRRRSPVARARR